MRYRRLKHIHLLCWLGVTAQVLVGCSSDVEDTSAGNSSFLVARVQLQSVERYASTNQKMWSELEGNYHLTFGTCLEDISIEGYPVREQDFEIKTQLGTYQRKTDFQGCLSWTEIIDFNFLAQERVFSHTLSLRGKGDYQGERSIDLAINPWKESHNEMVLDTRYVERIRWDEALSENSLNETFITTQKQLNPSQRPFILENVQVGLREIRYREGQQSIDFSYRMTPTLQRVRIDESVEKITVSKGALQLNLKLYENFAGSDELRHISTKTKDVRFENNEITGRLNFTIPENIYIESSSTLVMSVQAQPTEVQQNIVSEQGLVYFHDLRSNSNMGLERVRTIEQHLNDNFYLRLENLSLEQSQQGYRNQAGQWAEIFQTQEHNGPLAITSFNIRKGPHLGEFYNQRADRTVGAEIEVCFVDRMDQNRPITDTNIEIFKQELQDPTYKDFIREGRTDSNGCITATVETQYNIYETEKWIPYNLSFEILNGRYSGVSIERLIAVNPWSSVAFGRDLLRDDLPETIEGENPKLLLSRVKYTNEGNNLNEFKLNSYMQLGMFKTFQLNLWPKIERSHRYESEVAPTPLTFGEFEMEIHIYSPNTSQVSYTDIDFRDWNILTSAKKQVSVNSQGVINTEVDLPLLASDAYLLTYKNLMVISLRPLDEDARYLQQTPYALPFFGLHEGAELYTTELDENHRQNNEETLEFIEHVNNEKLSAIMLDDADPDLPTTIELYREHFRQEAARISTRAHIFEGSLEQLNNRDPLEGSWEQSPAGHYNAHHTTLSSGEMHSLTRISTRPPVETLKKFCRHLYELPSQSSGFWIFGGDSDQDESSDNYQNCMDNPREHIVAMPIQHIIRIIPFRERDDQGNIIGDRDARLLTAPDHGTFYRGDAAFSTTGERYTETYGERNSTGYHGGLDLTPRVPLFGARAGYAFEYFQFNAQEQGRADWLADRVTTQRTIHLAYENFELNFRAEVLPCLTVRQLHGANRVHVCENQTSLKTIDEQWYFIGHHNVRENGVLADANPMLSEDELASMIIRGAANYKSVWTGFSDEDQLMIIDKLKVKPLSDGMNKVRAQGVREHLFESYIDNAFPGAIIPDKNDTTVRDYQL